MTINNELIKELALDHFDGRMPSAFRAYLYDRYGEEPLAGDLLPQFFFPSILSDIKKYKAGKLDITVRTPIEKLKDRYEELSDITSQLVEELSYYRENYRYMNDFIKWMHLDDKYKVFRDNAYEITSEENPFLHYTM